MTSGGAPADGGLVDPETGQPITEGELEQLGWGETAGDEVAEGIADEPFASSATNIRVMCPRVRRALEGAGTPPDLTDDAVKDVVADSIADVILYTGGVFGKHLLVLSTDPATGAPAEYETSEALSLPEQSVIAAQAALNYFFQRFAMVKTSERIANEASNWEWTISPQLMQAQLALLKDLRDEALARITEQHALETYVGFLHVRDLHTSQLIEPWVATGNGFSLLGGQEIDPRFGTFG